MRKPIEDKSPLAAWATLSREGAGMSVEEVVDALAARGHAVKAATIRGIEGGSNGASVRLRRLMADVYGVTPPGQKETGPAQGGADLDALVKALQAQTDAIDRQATAINALVGVLGGTPNAEAASAVEELVDRYVSRRQNPDPVPSGER